MSFGYLSLQLCRTPGVRIISDGKNGMYFKVDISALTSPEQASSDAKNKIEHHWFIRPTDQNFGSCSELVRYTANHNAPSTIHETHIIPWGDWRQVLLKIRETG